MQDNKALINSSNEIRDYTFSKRLEPFLSPSSKRANQWSIFLSVICLLIGFIFSELNKTISILFFFIEFDVLNMILVFGMSFIINFLCLALIFEGLIRVVFNKKGLDLFMFIRTFSLIFLPLTFYLVIHYLLTATTIINLSIIYFADRILLIGFQALSVWILAYELMLNKGLRIENGLILALLTHLSGFTIILFLSF